MFKETYPWVPKKTEHKAWALYLGQVSLSLN